MSIFRALISLLPQSVLPQSALPVFVLLASSLAAVALAGSSPTQNQPAPFIDRYDSAGEIRRAVGESRAATHLGWLRANVVQTESVEQTVVDAVDAAMNLDWGPGQRDDDRRTRIGEWAMLAAGQIVEDRFPGQTALSSTGPFDPTPIERYCNCLRESARPCGCDVQPFGGGTCEFTPSCPGYFQGSCYYGIAVNMCAAESIIGIVSPLK